MGKGSPMKQLSLWLLALAVLFACGRPALASWASVSVETLIQDAELIVQGTVASIEPWITLGGRNYDFAVINVSDVLKGDNGITKVSIAQPSQSLLTLSTDILFDEGQEGAWLLSRNPSLQNEYSITHPSQFQPEGIVVQISATATSTSVDNETIPEPSGLALATLALWGLHKLTSRRPAR